MTGKLAGKIAIVTGASQGIGLAVAKRFLADGANLVLTYLPEHGSAERVMEQVGTTADRALVLAGDLRQNGFIASLFDAADRRFGAPNIVAAIAGVNLNRPVVDTTEEDYDRIFSINTRATFWIFREAARKISNGGRIVGTSSNMVLQGRAGHALYSASKAAVEQFVRTLAKEIGGRGITVMPLRPVRPIPPWCRNFHATLRPQSRRSGNWDPRRKLQMSLLFWPQKMPAGSQDRSSASTAGSSEISRPLRRNAPLVFAYACRNSCPPDFCMVQYIGGEASIMSSEQFIQGIIGGLAIGCIYSLIALGITIIIRATEILHFAQGELMMIGAMAGLSAMWMVDLPFMVVLLVGMIGGGVAAVTIELSIYRTLRTLRVPLINIIISTLGVSLILQNAARLIWGSEPLRYPPLFHTRGVDIAGFAISPQLIWIVVLGFVTMAALQLFFRYTRLGIAMQAAAQDAEAAQLMGISVKKTTTYTFVVAGVMAGAAGVLLGSLFFASFNMGFLTGIKAFVAATLGGLGSLTGAMVGGIAFGLIETFSGVLISTAYKDAVGMIVLIVILLLAPSGIFIRAGRRV